MNDPSNPYPGQLFNKPGGDDVYAGLVIDYKGDDVTAANFLSVLKGDSKTMSGVGSGKVIGSNAAENVFVFFSDRACAV